MSNLIKTRKLTFYKRSVPSSYYETQINESFKYEKSC